MNISEMLVLMDYADNSRFFQSDDDGVRHRRDRRYALHLPHQTSFTEEFVRPRIATTASLPCSERR